MSSKDLDWAHIILVMEAEHRERLRERFGAQARSARIEVLGIPDDYHFMDAELIEEIRAQVARILPETLEE